MVSRGRLLLTVGGTGGVRAGVIGDRTQPCLAPDRGERFEALVTAGSLGLAQSSVAHGVEAEVTWSGATLAKYKTGVAGLWLELEPGAVLYALHL